MSASTQRVISSGFRQNSPSNRGNPRVHPNPGRGELVE
jgi:hypothetical protein